MPRPSREASGNCGNSYRQAGGAINDPHNTKQRRYDGGVEDAAMATERIERRLAAILAADVAGYSRLIGLDEEGTLRRCGGCGAS